MSDSQRRLYVFRSNLSQSRYFSKREVWMMNRSSRIARNLLKDVREIWCTREGRRFVCIAWLWHAPISERAKGRYMAETRQRASKTSPSGHSRGACQTISRYHPPLSPTDNTYFRYMCQPLAFSQRPTYFKFQDAPNCATHVNCHRNLVHTRIRSRVESPHEIINKRLRAKFTFNCLFNFSFVHSSTKRHKYRKKNPCFFFTFRKNHERQ